MPNEHTIAENLQRLIDAKDNIAAAITAKGGTVAQGDGLEEFPTAINGISTGVDTSSDTVTAMYLGTGKTAHNAQGQQITGTHDINVYTVPSGTTSLSNTTIPKQGNSYAQTLYDYIVIPASVTSIVEYSSYLNAVFYDQVNLREVTLPSGVTQIPAYTFNSCQKLKKVVAPGWSTGKVYKETFSGCYSLESISIPNGITEIEQKAFNNCLSLTSITIPNSVSTIGQGAFGYCDGLTSVTIGSGITSINSYAFQYSPNLTTITINKPQGSVSGAPWGATNATVVWTG